MKKNGLKARSCYVFLLLAVLLEITACISLFVAKKTDINFEKLQVEIVDGSQGAFKSEDATMTVQYEGLWYSLYGVKDIDIYKKYQKIDAYKWGDMFFTNPDIIYSHTDAGRVSYYSFYLGIFCGIVSVLIFLIKRKQRHQKPEVTITQKDTPAI